MDVPVNFLTTPAAVVNQALDMLGQSGKIIGDIADGTTVAETARRNYGQGLRQLLRTAHWDFARKRAKLTLLGDAVSGNAIAPGVSPFVECPWSYAWAWPTDAVQGRWLPANPTNAQPTNAQGVPLTTGVSSLTNYPMLPGRFLISSSDQYPVETGLTPWNQLPDFQRTEGVGPTYRKIILTDCCNAEFVYTRLSTVIEEWDALFRQAFVTMIALAIAPVALEDVKVRIAMTDRLAKTLKNAVDNARVANGNESGYPQSVDHQPAWITARANSWWGATGPGGGGTEAFSGYTFYPYDGSMQWAGSVY